MSKWSSPNGQVSDFIGLLVKKFKIISKLTDKQSKAFKEQIQVMVSDGEGSIDQNAFKSVEEDIGVENFVLEVLGNVVERNPIRNQQEFNRNLTDLSVTLEKQYQDVTKRIQMLDRREEKVKILQESLKERLKDKVHCLEIEAMKKLADKQNEMKKTLTNIINQIRNKEKIMQERLGELRNSAKKMKELETKEKLLMERVKGIDKRDKQTKSKELQSQLIAKDSQINTLERENQKLQGNVREISKKYKNLDLAYRKTKQDLTKKQAERKQQALNLETSHNRQPKSAIEAINKDKDSVNGKAQSQQCPFTSNLRHLQISQIALNSSNEQQQSQEVGQRYFDLPLFSSLTPALAFLQNSSNQEKASDKCTTPTDKAANDLQQVLGWGHCPAQQKTLEEMIQTCVSSSFQKQTVEKTLETMLAMLENSPRYQTVLQAFQTPIVMEFLQRAYLQHETVEEIAEMTSTIISRVRMNNGLTEVGATLRKAFEMRLRAEKYGGTHANSFLVNNIRSILL